MEILMKRLTTTTVTTLLIGGTALAGSAVATSTAFAAPQQLSGVHTDTNEPSRTQQKQLTQAWLQLWNGDYRQAERIVSPSVRVRAALMDGGDGSAIKGAAGMVDFVQQIRAAFPDLRFDIAVGPIIDGEYVVVRWVATGTYGGGFPGATAAPGTTVRFTGTDTLRVKHGRITDYWLNADTQLLLQQLKVTTG
jgi:predicted ester cyclase